MRRVIGLVSGVLAATFAVAAAAQTTIEFISFPGSSTMPAYVAQDKGLFAKEGLTVNVTPTPSSGYQIQNLVAGKFQIAGTAIDNLIAYMEGQGTAKLDREPDLITILGGSSTELTLIAQPSIKKISELKGKEFALDSLSTGFAFVLRKMLEKNGLGMNDYKFVAVGGTPQRLAALKEGKYAAALMTEPFTGQARAAGFSDLGEGLDYVNGYQGSVHITNRAWAKANEKAVVGYLRATLAAIDWIYDPANHAEAAKILMSRIKGMPEPAAVKSVQGLVKGRAALARKGELDMKGIASVIALREQYGEPKKKLGSADKYIDLSYYKKATGMM